LALLPELKKFMRFMSDSSILSLKFSSFSLALIALSSILKFYLKDSSALLKKTWDSFIKTEAFSI